MTNILVFPCGSEIGLEIHRSLHLEKDITLFGRSSAFCHGRFVYENYRTGAPLCDYPSKLIEYLKNQIQEHSIDWIYPTNEAAIFALRDSGLPVIGHPKETIEICNDKGLTYERLKGVVRVPEELFESSADFEFPAFAKPRVGHSGKDCFIVERQIDMCMVRDSHLLLEYLPGPEYTIDCFSDHNENLRLVGPRVRANIGSGISQRTLAVGDERLYDMAVAINKAMKFTGAWFFQVKEASDGEPCLMEVGARLAGSSALSRINGVNFARLSIYVAEKKPVEIMVSPFVTEISRSLDVKAKIDYEFDRVYVDYDDTLIIKGKINYILAAFLLKQRDLGKEIIALTRGEGQTEPSKDAHLMINTQKVPEGASKSGWIKTPAIFIDDSFRERKEVHEALGIPVFSTDAISAFI